MQREVKSLRVHRNGSATSPREADIEPMKHRDVAGGFLAWLGHPVSPQGDAWHVGQAITCGVNDRTAWLPDVDECAAAGQNRT